MRLSGLPPRGRECPRSMRRLQAGALLLEAVPGPALAAAQAGVSGDDRGVRGCSAGPMTQAQALLTPSATPLLSLLATTCSYYTGPVHTHVYTYM